MARKRKQKRPPARSKATKMHKARRPSLAAVMTSDAFAEVEDALKRFAAIAYLTGYCAASGVVPDTMGKRWK
jgi:hypothetical protein